MNNIKWLSMKEVLDEGLYLHMAGGDLEGNSKLTYISKINNIMYINDWISNVPITQKQKLICPANTMSLFFGPIPKIK